MDGRRLIDADDFVEWLLADAITDEQREFAENVRYAAERMKPADAVPVKHGRWETVEDWDGDEHYKCSVCGAETFCDGDPDDNDYLYCPHCGAKMEETK